MTEYKITIIGGHILIGEADNYILIDTGSPASFHADGQITIGDKQASVPTSLMSVDAAYVSRQVGAGIKGLIGMDLIVTHRMSLDVAGGVIRFDDDETEGWEAVPARYLQGCAVVPMTVNGMTSHIILDTGAPVSYISPAFTEGLAVADRVSDFSPFVSSGTYEVNLYDVTAAFHGKEFALRAGNLPEEMAMVLRFMHVDGVFGIDCLKHFRLRFGPDRILVKEL